jgi:hypothetical protein
MVSSIQIRLSIENTAAHCQRVTDQLWKIALRAEFYHYPANGYRTVSDIGDPAHE